MMTAAFFLLGGLAVISSLFMITRKNPVHSALWMLLTFFSVAGIFVQLDAEYIAVIQVLIYAGAILVLYLFVVMLLNPGSSGFMKFPLRYVIGAGAALVVFLQVLMTVSKSGFLQDATVKGLNYPEVAQSNVKLFGMELFQTYLVPFEVASILLLVAMIGAIIIAKKD